MVYIYSVLSRLPSSVITQRGLIFKRFFSTKMGDFKSPQGFRAGSVSCGIKKNGNLDMVLISSDRPCSVAGVFTTNKVQAAPVLVSRDLIKKYNGEGIQAVVINSGCANAVTGDKGLHNALSMSAFASNVLGVPKEALVMSTGVIGQHLDMAKVEMGITDAAKKLSGDKYGWDLASRGIMTTDTVPKLSSSQVHLSDGKVITLTGISKGAGMIHPNMATMLSVICTDANISPKLLQQALSFSVNKSFNNIDIDGDTSTNDTLCVLANGASENTPINDPNSHDFQAFQNGLLNIAIDLAQKIVRDGEGATKFVSVVVRGAPNEKDGKTVARSIATSSLVKTALYGQDANWGRVLAAVGYSSVDVDPSKISLWFTTGNGDAAKGGNIDKSSGINAEYGGFSFEQPIHTYPQSSTHKQATLV
eukprot:TRINITY_DN2977_c0_g1_i1.p2 TRINITY_DN2977_c0_g1~~TRINITY_DN2977_c0_g1_i1.p2  ORF type:complete len:419 (+),score=93.06 TRINITY_DN2977_c0_g1_i1:165-1421(+)